MGQATGDPVDIDGSQAVSAGGFPKSRAHLERGSSADHRGPVCSVATINMIDDGITPLPAQIDVDIGEIFSLGVQESFEAQTVCERVDLGDSEGIGDDGSGS